MKKNWTLILKYKHIVFNFLIFKKNNRLIIIYNFLMFCKIKKSRFCFNHSKLKKKKKKYNLKKLSKYLLKSK